MRLIGEGLTKSYNGKKVVNDIRLELSGGEVVGLLGPNGAGKTTTFHILTGFVRPERGRIFIDAQEITNLPIFQRARLGLGYLSQEPSVFRKLTVKDNILAILEMTMVKSSKEERYFRLNELLKKLNLEGLASQYAYNLSGGERRRCEIARALVAKPNFLLLDEPFTGIDPICRAEIQDIIKQLKKEGLGILVTDHNVRETLEITDRAYLIYDARILLSGTSEELVSNEKARNLYLGEKFRI